MIYDYDKKAFVEGGKELPMKCGLAPDDLATLIAGVALKPETAQGAYIEILKMMAGGKVTTVFHDRHMAKENDDALRRYVVHVNDSKSGTVKVM